MHKQWKADEVSAKTVRRVIAAGQAGKLRQVDGVERQIAEALAKEGYTVNTNIGCSGYRVSAAVVHLERPGEYILGILCDGEIYHHASTARDRELAQEAVLRELGWNIRHVWTPDWWDNPAKETSARLPYHTIHPPQETMTPEDFTLPQRASLIARKIAQTVNAEGPISHGLLCYCVLRSYGTGRMGAPIDWAMAEILSRFAFTTTKQDSVVIYWPSGVKPEACECFRTADKEGDRRNADDLPAEETTCAVREVLHLQIGLPEGDLAHEVAKSMGTHGWEPPWSRR